MRVYNSILLLEQLIMRPDLKLDKSSLQVDLSTGALKFFLSPLILPDSAPKCNSVQKSFQKFLGEHAHRVVCLWHIVTAALHILNPINFDLILPENVRVDLFSGPFTQVAF